MWKKIKQFTTDNYISSGLIAMWDGIENIARGVHSDDTNVWIDLVGGLSATLGTDASVQADHIANTSDRSDFAKIQPNGKDLDYKTIEVVIKKTNTTYGIYGHGNTNAPYTSLDIYYASNSFCQANRPRAKLKIPNASVWLNKRISIAFTENDDFTASGAYLNGMSATDGSTYNDYWDISKNSIGGNSTYVRGRGMTGEFCALRLYDRRLSPEEIAANYDIDKIRFNLS